MGAKWPEARKTGSKFPTVPPHLFPKELILEASLKRCNGVDANDCMKDLLAQIPDLLAKHKIVKDGDEYYHLSATGTRTRVYKNPGQTMSGVRARFDQLVETDAAFWDEANAAGVPLDTPRPGSAQVVVEPTPQEEAELDELLAANAEGSN